MGRVPPTRPPPLPYSLLPLSDHLTFGRYTHCFCSSRAQGLSVALWAWDEHRPAYLLGSLGVLAAFLPFCLFITQNGYGPLLPPPPPTPTHIYTYIRRAFSEALMFDCKTTR